MGKPIVQKMDLEELKQRRQEARLLLNEGVAQSEVALRLQISRQSVSRWARLHSREFAELRHQGRKPGLTEPARAKLRTALLAGPKAVGIATECGPCRGCASSLCKLSPAIQPGPRLAALAPDGV